MYMYMYMYIYIHTYILWHVCITAAVFIHIHKHTYILCRLWRGKISKPTATKSENKNQKSVRFKRVKKKSKKSVTSEEIGSDKNEKK